MSISWIPKEQYDRWRELGERLSKGMIWGFPKREPREDDNIKLAWVEIEGKRKMLGVDNVTMKGYKMNEDIPTWKRPLEEQKYDSFERWCTTFDV